MIIAIQIANASSIAGFERALDAIAGRTALEIVSPGAGVDETRIPALGWLRQYGQMAPVIERDVTLIEDGKPAGAMRLLGVDMLRERPVREYRVETAAGVAAPTPQDALRTLTDPASAIVPATFARLHGLGVGSTLVIQTGDRTLPLVVRALLTDDGPAQALEGRLVVMDIAAAQQAVSGFGYVDRLDLPLDSGVDVASAATAIAAHLPEGLTVERPDARGEQVEQMLAAFHLNLTALSVRRAHRRALSHLQHGVGGGVVATRGDRHTARRRRNEPPRFACCFSAKRRRCRLPAARSGSRSGGCSRTSPSR